MAHPLTFESMGVINRAKFADLPDLKRKATPVSVLATPAVAVDGSEHAFSELRWSHCGVHAGNRLLTNELH